METSITRMPIILQDQMKITYFYILIYVLSFLFNSFGDMHTHYALL